MGRGKYRLCSRLEKPGWEAESVVRAPSRKGYLPFFEAALTAPALLEALVFF